MKVTLIVEDKDMTTKVSREGEEDMGLSDVADMLCRGLSAAWGFEIEVVIGLEGELFNRDGVIV